MSDPNLSPTKNPTPRQSFRESADNVTKHRNLVDLPEFKRGIHFALLEHQAKIAAQTVDGASAMAAGFRLQGAIEFAGILRTLAETDTPLPRKADHNLLHQS